MNQTLQKVAFQQAYQIAEMTIDMAECHESLEDAWLNFFSFIANHNVSQTEMTRLRNLLIEAEIQLNPHDVIEKANKRLRLEEKWRKDRADREASK